MADAGDVARMQRIIDRLKDYGVVVREVPGWEQRGRTFAYVPVGIVDHHDASTRKSGEWGALGVVTTGYGALPGPLSQFVTARCLDGIPKVAIVAAGRANHAGRGGPRLMGGYTVGENDGNDRLYGNEKANDGAGEPHTPAAHFAADAVFAAVLAEVRGEGLDRLIGHKEWAGERKTDPQYDMDWRRSRVATFRAPVEPPPAPATLDLSKEDSMRNLIVKDPSRPHVFLVVPGVSKKHIKTHADIVTYRTAGAVVASLTQAELDAYPEVTA